MEEETKKKVSTTSYIMGQLMMFISIYYAPLHLAVGRSHTIIFLALLYLYFISSTTITNTIFIRDLLPQTLCIILAFNVYSLIISFFNYPALKYTM